MSAATGRAERPYQSNLRRPETRPQTAPPSPMPGHPWPDKHVRIGQHYPRVGSQPYPLEAHSDVSYARSIHIDKKIFNNFL